MNILMISDVYFPRINGVSSSIQTFRQELGDLGHRVCLIAPDYGQLTQDEGDILRIPSRQVPLDPEDRMMQLSKALARSSSMALEKFDLVHIQTPFVAHYIGLKLSRQLSIPRIATYHTFFEEYLSHYVPLLPKTLLRRGARWLSRRQCNNLDGLIVPSQAMAEVLGRYGIRTPTRIIPTGIDIELFRHGNGQAFRDRYGIPANRPMLVHVGRIAFEKNIDFLLQVVGELKRHYPDILLVIAGKGPAERHLQQLARQLSIADNLLLVGYLPREGALADCYRAGDVFIFASRTETQGLVLLEAMSLGLPVVSTAVMGTRDLLQAGRGVLIAEENITDFSAKVRRILEDPDLRQTLQQEGPVYMEHWEAKQLATQLIEFYHDIVALEGRRMTEPL